MWFFVLNTEKIHEGSLSCTFQYKTFIKLFLNKGVVPVHLVSVFILCVFF